MSVNTWDTSKNERMIDRLFKDLQPTSILDVGCGNGELAKHIFEKFSKDIYLMDIMHDQLREVKDAVGNKGVVLGSVENLPFRDNAIGIVFIKDVLHHIKYPEIAVRELLRVADKNIVIVEANRYNPVMYVFWTKQRGHEHFSRGKFHKLVKNACYGHQCCIKTFNIDSSLHYITIIPESITRFLSSSKILTKVVVALEKLIEVLVFPLTSFNVVIIDLKTEA
jgi:ubiquinone/menaquinone biosynthesis C-methylase UbiE